MKPELSTLIKNKKVLFISTKNVDYIRNNQEIELIKKDCSKVTTIAYSNKNYLLRIIKVYFSLIWQLIKNDYEVLFIGFAPQFVFPLFPFFSKKKLLVLDFFISFYDTLVDDRKKVKKNSLLARLIHLVDAYVLKKADWIFSDTKAHAKYFSEEFSIPLKKIITLYIKADTKIFSNQTGPSTKKIHPFTVLYFGSILPVQGLEIILETMTLLKADSSIHFVIIGPLKKKYGIDATDYPQTTFIEWLSQQELALEIEKADLCLAGHFSATIGKANRTIAGKTYIYMAMNKPVILGDSDANHELFIEDSQTIYVERGNALDLAKSIQKFKRRMTL